MLDEETIEELERQFPEMAALAFATARAEALAAGLSVVETHDNILWEVFPNGTRRAIKALEPRMSVTPGTKITIT
ncbi:MAG: hypothetical protein AB1813_03010 [Verrucomicrobiota bacterium]